MQFDVCYFKTTTEILNQKSEKYPKRYKNYIFIFFEKQRTVNVNLKNI